MISESPGDPLVISSKLGMYKQDDPCAVWRAMQFLELLETNEGIVLADDLVASAYLAGARLTRTRRQEDCARLIIDRIGDCAYLDIMKSVPPALPLIVSLLTEKEVVIQPCVVRREFEAETINRETYRLCRRCLRQARPPDMSGSFQLPLFSAAEIYTLHAGREQS